MVKKISKVKLKKFNNIFLDKKKEILNNLMKTPDELDIDGDDIDVVQGVLISEQNKILSKRDVATLEKINIALEKIQNGTFGICEGCDDLIAEKRLEAIPYCQLCISCQEIEDFEFKQINS